MKGKENKKETKKVKSDSTTAKEQSEYQKDKTRKSVTEISVFHPKKK